MVNRLDEYQNYYNSYRSYDSSRKPGGYQRRPYGSKNKNVKDLDDPNLELQKTRTLISYDDL